MSPHKEFDKLILSYVSWKGEQIMGKFIATWTIRTSSLTL